MEKNSVKTKKRILEKALSLFAKKGYKNVTMTDICIETGLSRGGLYRHYGSTHQIFSEIINSLMNAQHDELSQKIKQDVPASIILTEILERYKNEMLDTQGSLSVAIYEFFSADTSKQDNALFQQYQKSYLMWKRLLEYGIKHKEFNVVDIDAIFDLIVFSYQGVRMYSTLMTIDERTPNHIISLIKTILLPNDEV